MLMQDGWTALIAAAHFGKVDAMRLLLDFGANIEAKDRVRRSCDGAASWQPECQFTMQFHCT